MLLLPDNTQPRLSFFHSLFIYTSQQRTPAKSSASNDMIWIEGRPSSWFKLLMAQLQSAMLALKSSMHGLYSIS